ncbi:MAG: hypothetical protein AAF652_13515 [Cyanobacteria bacterium P01_C01_bin.72]
MSRLKILLLALIIIALGIIFVQNRDPIALKLLCADSSQACLYQTPTLPLSVWIALATLTGMLSNLLVQSLNLYGYRDFSRKRAILDEELYPENKGWKNKQAKATTRELKDSVQDRIPETRSYETRQEPQNVERSGSTYSYKYREAGDRPKPVQDSTRNNSTESQADHNATPEADDEDWI